MSNYDRLIDKLPYALRNDRNKLFYEAIASIFDDFDNYMAQNDNFAIVDFSEGLALDNLGKQVGVVRGSLDDERYRRRIKRAYHSIYLMPTRNNLINFIQSVTGETVEDVEENPNGEPLVFKAKVPISLDETEDLIENLDDYFTAGGRFESQIVKNYEALRFVMNWYTMTETGLTGKLNLPQGLINESVGG